MTQSALDKAYQHCVTHGFRYTDPRKHVLQILLKAGKPLGAYEILDELSRKIDKPKPPTVYRAIQFWHEEGFVHCVDSLKSYVACSHTHHIGQVHFLVCTECNYAQELDCKVNYSVIPKLAAKNDFIIQNYALEIKGLCSNCAFANPSPQK